MPIISEIQLAEFSRQHVLSIRKTIHFDIFPETAKEAFDAVMKFAEKHDILFSDGPFACYHNADLENLDVELGFPVAKPVLGSDEIFCRAIPLQKAAVGLYQGPYEESDPLMFAIMDWISKNGYEMQGDIYHCYLNDENRSKDELLTKMVVPVL